MRNTIRDCLERTRAVWLVLLLFPLFVSSSELKPAWDEIFFLHNGVCVAREFWHLHLGAVDGCLSTIAKSPVMAFLLIPAGDLQGNIQGLQIAPVSLGLACLSMVILIAYLSTKANVPATALLVAAIGIRWASPIRDSGASFMSDGLLALIIGCTVLLLMVEWAAMDRSTADDVIIGIVWGVVLSLGILTKMTYFYFAALIVPPAFVLSVLRGGVRKTVIKSVVGIIVCIPALFIFIRYFMLYYGHAIATSFGSISSFYDDGLSVGSFLAGTFNGIWSVLVVSFGLAAAATLSTRKDNGRLAVSAYAFIVVAGYFALVALSVNRDPRFFWPVWIALPLCFAMAAPQSVDFRLRRLGWSFAMAFVVAVALASLSYGRFDLAGLREAEATLNAIPTGPKVSVVTATDEPHFNVESLLLAQQLHLNENANKKIGTVVYDITAGHDVQYSLDRLDSADYVVMRFPAPAGAPDWANTHSVEFHAFLEESKSKMTVPRYATISLYGSSH